VKVVIGLVVVIGLLWASGTLDEQTDVPRTSSRVTIREWGVSPPPTATAVPTPTPIIPTPTARPNPSLVSCATLRDPQSRSECYDYRAQQAEADYEEEYPDDGGRCFPVAGCE
jgi:hypothetical protein